MERIAEVLPRPKARAIGVVYLLYFLAAFLAVFLTKGLLVSVLVDAMAPRKGRECFGVARESKRSTEWQSITVALPNKSLKPTAAIAAAA